jgi:hypothetical protein
MVIGIVVIVVALCSYALGMVHEEIAQQERQDARKRAPKPRVGEVLLITACGAQRTMNIAGGHYVVVPILRNVIGASIYDALAESAIRERTFRLDGIQQGMLVYREVVP